MKEYMINIQVKLNYLLEALDEDDAINKVKDMVFEETNLRIHNDEIVSIDEESWRIYFILFTTMI